MTESDIAIVGAGFGGLGAAIQLTRHGRHDFVVFDQAKEIGGTWRDNSYPGCACDVPSHLYSYSFALNPHWSETYSGQAEIWDYLRVCVERFRLGPQLRLGCRIENAAWDSTVSRLATHHGGRRAPGASFGGGDRTAARTVYSRHPRTGHLRRRGVPLGAVEPRTRAARPEGGGRRHRRVRGPVRARDPADGRAADPLSAHASLGDPATVTGHHRPGTGGLPTGAGCSAAQPHADLLGSRGVRVRVPAPRAEPVPAAGGRGAPAAPGPRSRASGQADPSLRHGLQANRHLQRVPARARST